METNIRQGHGPLGVLYPTRTWTAAESSLGDQGRRHALLVLLSAQRVERSGSSNLGRLGRSVRRSEGDRIYRDAQDTVETSRTDAVPFGDGEAPSNVTFKPAWIGASEPRSEANHPPVAVCNGDLSRTVLTRAVPPGGTIRLSAEASRDPDDDQAELPLVELCRGRNLSRHSRR